MPESFYYLAIDLGCILLPFVFSFDKRVKFASTWRAFWPACLITLTGFIIWDVIFTQLGVWGFNESYLLGGDIVNLPLEEWLFFICIPYACTFTYAAVKAYGPQAPLSKSWKALAWILTVGCTALAFLNFDRLYTAYTCLLTALFLGFHLTFIRKPYFGQLLLTYLFLIIPFLISNGLLTGLSFWDYPLLNTNPNEIADQIVWYNNEENLGVRLFSVPLDDFIYGFLLIGMNITLYEYFLNRQYHKDASMAW